MKTISPKIIIAAAVVSALIIGGVIYWNSQKKSENEAVEEAAEATEKMVESATQGTLPSLQTNPLESRPDLNPADKANPFKNIKTNPFE